MIQIPQFMLCTDEIGCCIIDVHFNPGTDACAVASTDNSVGRKTILNSVMYSFDFISDPGPRHNIRFQLLTGNTLPAANGQRPTK